MTDEEKIRKRIVNELITTLTYKASTEPALLKHIIVIAETLGINMDEFKDKKK